MREQEPVEVSLYMFDVLGFSALLAEIGPREIYSKYTELLEILGPQDGGRPFLSAEPIGDDGTVIPVSGVLDVHTTYFSDTLMIWAPYHPVAMQVLTDLVLDLFCNALMARLPLRGGVAFGQAIMDQERRIYVGQPIVESYRIESSQQWCGCSFGPSMSTHPTLFPVHYYWPFDQQWKADRFPTSGRSLALDWPRRWRERFSIADFHSAVADLSRPGYEEYWEVTSEFFAESATEAEWWVGRQGVGKVAILSVLEV